MRKPLSGIVGALVMILLVGPSWAGDGTTDKEKALEGILLSLDSIRAACEELAKASNSEGGPEDAVVVELVDRVIPAVRGASTQTTNALRELKVRSKQNNVKMRSEGEKRFHADKAESSEERKRFHAIKAESSEERKRFHAVKVKSVEERKRFHTEKVESSEERKRFHAEKAEEVKSKDPMDR